MVFWLILSAVVVAMLAFSWWSAGREKPGLMQRNSSAQRGVDEAKSQQQLRDLNHLKPGS